jgi:hypothetical protein
MSKLFHCPLHPDSTASMKQYGDMCYCFGCGAYISTAELNLPSQITYSKPEPTNIAKELEYIRTLPKKTIRGLEFPYDDTGFYIVYPNKAYYVKRMFEGSRKYIAPSGHKRPLLIMPGGSDTHLVICEGEMNCLSFYSANWDQYRLCSPGSANDFLKYLDYYCAFPKITIIADKDAVGICLGLHLKEILLRKNKSVTLELVDKDLNEMLQQDTLKEWIERNIR